MAEEDAHLIYSLRRELESERVGRGDREGGRENGSRPGTMPAFQ